MVWVTNEFHYMYGDSCSLHLQENGFLTSRGEGHSYLHGGVLHYFQFVQVGGCSQPRPSNNSPSTAALPDFETRDCSVVFLPQTSSPDSGCYTRL